MSFSTSSPGVTRRESTGDEFCSFTILFLKMKCFKFLVLRDDKIVLPEKKFSCCLCLQQLVDNFNDNHMLKYTKYFRRNSKKANENFVLLAYTSS